MIIFKSIKWKNLLSTGDVWTEVSLNTHGQTLIVGENGAGKSTILDALSFALYGKPFRKVNKGQLLNSINKKGLLVECEFNVGNAAYLVRRGIKPNVFEVYANGTLINLDAAVGDYQEMLDKQILKLNQKSFSQIVVLGSASFVPFMQLTAAHRREVIEDLLGIEVFTVMNSLLKEKVADNKTKVLQADTWMRAVAEKIQIEQKHLEVLQSSNDEQVAKKQTQINETEADLVPLREELTQVRASLNKFKLLDKQQTALVQQQTNIVSDLRLLNGKVSEHRKHAEFFNQHDDCPVCKQNIGDQHKISAKQVHDDAIAEINDKKAVLDEELEQLVRDLDKVRTQLKQREKLNDREADITSKIHSFEYRLKGLQEDINQITQNTGHIEDNKLRLKELKHQLKQQISDREALGKRKLVLDVASAMLKDSGIKTKIIKQYIPVINKLINKYLAAMDFFVNFELDESFEEKIRSRFRDEFSYASFSEGEKSRLDLALLFTWRTIARLRNSTSTNLLILDEVFDGSLDNQGNDELFKILSGLMEGNNVFVISHKTDAYLDKFERVLKFEKQRNFSRMITL